MSLGMFLTRPAVSDVQWRQLSDAFGVKVQRQMEIMLSSIDSTWITATALLYTERYIWVRVTIGHNYIISVKHQVDFNSNILYKWGLTAIVGRENK